MIPEHRDIQEDTGRRVHKSGCITTLPQFVTDTVHPRHFQVVPLNLCPMMIYVLTVYVFALSHPPFDSLDILRLPCQVILRCTMMFLSDCWTALHIPSSRYTKSILVVHV